MKNCLILCKNEAKKVRHDNKAFSAWYFPLVISLGIIFAFLLLWGSKTALGIIIVTLLLFFYVGFVFKIGIENSNRCILYFIIFSIPFPYVIQFLGKDALTITILIIFLLFFVVVLSRLFQRKRFTFKPKFALILPSLIFVSLTLSFIFNIEFIGQSIRYYAANTSGILLYFLVLAIVKTRLQSIRIIKIILFTLVLQVGICFVQWMFPAAAKYFLPFATRVFLPQAVISPGGFIRATGTVWDYELLAEWFLVGGMLAVYLIYETKRYVYLFLLFSYIVGIVFTKTRSDIFLLGFGFILVCILLNLFKKDYKYNSIKIILSVVFGLILLSVVLPGQMGEFGQRLMDYFHSSRLISPEAINRKEVWGNALNIFLKSPTIFGRGLYSVESLYSWAGSFHSLYLTILYKLGVFGLVIYAIFWLKMMRRAWHTLVNKRKCENWYAIFFLFIAIILMLIDGIKIEYLRYGHTIQFAWVIYALLVVSLKQSEENNEDTVVS